MEPIEPLDVVGYVRVSTVGQADNGISIPDQREKLALYAELHNLRLVEVIEDAGASAKSLKRPGLVRALALLQAGEASGLLVAKLDRLTRSVRDLGELLDAFESAKAQLFSVADQIDTRTAMGRMVLNIMTTIAQWERETIVERTRGAVKFKKANGESLGQVPYGFKVDPADPRRSKKLGRPIALVEDLAELATAAMIRQLGAEGYSLRAIAAHLDASGISPKRGGKRWAFSTIRAILARRDEPTSPGRAA